MPSTYQAAPDIDVITSNIPIPTLGIIPVNAFVIKGTEPILVDTGVVVEHDEFLSALRSVIDPAELKWIWLTHTDFDHVGSLAQLLAENPDVRLLTTFVGVGVISLYSPLPMDRLYFLNPGETVTIGDRTLTAFKPPVFDNPTTTGFYEEKSGALFSSDSFGACLDSVPQNAGDLSESELRDGQVFWATVDSPWLHKVDTGVFGKELNAIRDMAPKMILSSHLPAASGDLLDSMIEHLAAAPAAPPFVGPDQAGLEQLLQQMAAAPQ
jgi:flavorubredoxin